MFKFKKKNVIGVSISPEIGLEVAQVDYFEKKVIKYGRAPLPYDNSQKSITDIDIFKETLQDLLLELAIPKGTEIVLNIPATTFGIMDFPASLTDMQVSLAIEEKLRSLSVFEQTEPLFDYRILPSSTMQSNRYVYAATNKTLLLEIAMFIEEIGYSLVNVDASVNSILNSLVYNDRVETNSGNLWTLLIVDNTFCRVLTLQDNFYIESFEEKISIGKVLGDEENYATVLSTVNPVIAKSPTKRLYIISNTEVISASKLANLLNFKGQIIHQEVNSYATEPFINIDENTVDSNLAKSISLEVIGAAIRKDFSINSSTNLNLFNASMGDVYDRTQPPEIRIGNKVYILTNETLLNYGITYLILMLILAVVVLFPINSKIQDLQKDISSVNSQIKDVETFLKNNNDISTSLFDEGDEIRIGLAHNKKIYTYYTIIGTEIPTKLWLTGLQLGKYITITGQADNIESIYSFFRNIKDYNSEDKLKLQKLGLAVNKSNLNIKVDENFDTESIISSMNADFYEFKFSNAPEEKAKEKQGDKDAKNSGKTSTRTKTIKNVPQLGELD